jgi:hypothetical protein
LLIIILRTHTTQAKSLSLTYFRDSDARVNPVPSDAFDPITSCAMCGEILGKSVCEYDCDGVFEGAASIDDCGVCSGGATGKVSNADIDCSGICFGPFLDYTFPDTTGTSTITACMCASDDPSGLCTGMNLTLQASQSMLTPIGTGASTAELWPHTYMYVHVDGLVIDTDELSVLVDNVIENVTVPTVWDYNIPFEFDWFGIDTGRLWVFSYGGLFMQNGASPCVLGQLFDEAEGACSYPLFGEFLFNVWMV